MAFEHLPLALKAGRVAVRTALDSGALTAAIEP